MVARAFKRVTVASRTRISLEGDQLAGDVDSVVREVCFWLPEVTEQLSHGSPNFKVRGKTFATYAVNHHGDGRVALWLNAPRGSQEAYVEAEPAHFFVPPYVGPRGWLGVRLDRQVTWKRIAALVREAYETVAPAELSAQIGPPPAFKGPTRALAAAKIDPLKSRRAAAVIARMRKICIRYPESSEGTQFGHPAWRAAKKTFASVRLSEGRLTLSCWVGADRQGLLSNDARYRIAPYTGHNGWIDLDVAEGCDWDEVTQLIDESFRHFALKRMLRGL